MHSANGRACLVFILRTICLPRFSLCGGHQMVAYGYYWRWSRSKRGVPSLQDAAIDTSRATLIVETNRLESWFYAAMKEPVRTYAMAKASSRWRVGIRHRRFASCPTGSTASIPSFTSVAVFSQWLRRSLNDRTTPVFATMHRDPIASQRPVVRPLKSIHKR